MGAATGPDQDRLRNPGSLARLDIAERVADQDGLLQVQLQLLSRLKDQTRMGFAAGAVLLRSMRAHKNTVHPAAGFLDLNPQSPVDVESRIKTHQATPDG